MIFPTESVMFRNYEVGLEENGKALAMPSKAQVTFSCQILANIDGSGLSGIR